MSTKIKWGTMSPAQIQAVIVEAQNELDSRQKKRDALDAVRSQVSDLLARTGLTLDDLAVADRKKPVVSRGAVAAKYRNPDNSEQTWTGRGKRPIWLAEKIASGAALDSFLIPATA